MVNHNAIIVVGRGEHTDRYFSVRISKELLAFYLRYKVLKSIK